MTSIRNATITGASCLLLVGAVPAVAGTESAQPAPPPQQPQQGPLVLERIESGFVVAPDVKGTDLASGGTGVWTCSSSPPGRCSSEGPAS